MRIAKSFGERKHVLKSEDPKRKYFFAYEGSETERLYFDGLREDRAWLSGQTLIEIVPLVRSDCEKGLSHPKRVLECLLDFLGQLEKGEYRLSSILEWTVDYWKENSAWADCGISEEELRKYLTDWFCENGGLCLQDTVSSLEEISEQLVKSLTEKLSLNECVKGLQPYLSAQNITYDSSYDIVCVIVDRDQKSFKENQYDDVMQMCEEKGFRLYVTNPCFEFWLLLHFDEVLALDRETLRENPRVTSKQRYTEKQLRTLVEGYHKNRIQFPCFAGRIEKAIENEKQFAETLPALKNEVGSNIGLLLSELRKKPELSETL